MPYIPSRDLEPRVLAGDTRAIARLLSRAETGAAEARESLDAMFTHAGRAHVVGVTGVPGSGKSTLVARLAAAVRRGGRSVGDHRRRSVQSRFPAARSSATGCAWVNSAATPACSCAAWRRAGRSAGSPAARWKPSTFSTPPVSTMVIDRNGRRRPGRGGRRARGAYDGRRVATGPRRRHPGDQGRHSRRSPTSTSSASATGRTRTG